MAWAGTAGNHNTQGGDIRNKQESQRRRDTKLQGKQKPDRSRAKCYPTLSVYSWETESLRLSQSPHDMRGRPGPNLVMFLHPKCLQVSSSPPLLFKAAVRCSWALCTNVFYINVLYILCSGEYLLQEWSLMFTMKRRCSASLYTLFSPPPAPAARNRHEWILGCFLNRKL